MMNAASTSNPSFIVEVGKAYPYPSHFVAPNFVTMKLSGKDTYNVWETQILCLLKSHQMYGFIDGQFPRPAGNGKGKVGDIESWIISDSLVKCWILGTLSDGVSKKVVNRLRRKHLTKDFTAKDLWDELQRIYFPWFYVQETKLRTRQAESEKKNRDENKDRHNKRLYDSILKGNTRHVIDRLKEDSLNPWDNITNNGNTVLHVAVGSSTKYPELLGTLLEMTPAEKLLDIINSDGSTLLHVAAIGGDIEAVNMLVERNPELLLAMDKEGNLPLALSISNMHIKTSHCLSELIEKNGYGHCFSGQRGADLVLLAIYFKDFPLARKIFNNYPRDVLSDDMLIALAQNFPRELNFWERRGFGEEWDRIVAPYIPTLDRVWNYLDSSRVCQPLKIFFILFTVLCTVAAMFSGFLKVIVRLFFADMYQIHKDATSLLYDVCNTIFIEENSGICHHYYTTLTLEATRRNASTLIRRIMRQFPDAISITNEDGHNFIQYSVISRSQKIYNLIYEMSEHKNIYRTIKDFYGNNLLHLAARLAPTDKLNLISGAALQIQRELQWFKEVERFVSSLNRIQKNSDDETPEMVFTREHKDLVIEGENWIKKTAESYTITAALIITIVFAAAITVPGGNNQELGIPIFTNNIAFTVFAISDAISLFTAVTSLLMFLSILTTRFAEQDFLFKLPRKLIIGLTMLFLSTTAMIVAFGATLFLVFGQSNLLMLIPIGALTCLPIASFVTLQCPLILELISATYGGGIFVREEYDYFY